MTQSANYISRLGFTLSEWVRQRFYHAPAQQIRNAHTMSDWCWANATPIWHWVIVFRRWRLSCDNTGVFSCPAQSRHITDIPVYCFLQYLSVHKFKIVFCIFCPAENLFFLNLKLISCMIHHLISYVCRKKIKKLNCYNSPRHTRSEVLCNI